MEKGKYNALIICREGDSRTRLRGAATELPSVANVSVHDTFERALMELTSSPRCDLIFISALMPFDSCMSFVAQAKQLRSSENAAFIMVLNSREQDPTLFSRFILGGISGFLLEPYSLNGIRETTKLAARVKLQRGLERRQIALHLLIPEILGKLDIVTALKKQKFSPDDAWGELSDACSVLQVLDKEGLEVFFDVVEEHISGMGPPQPLHPDFLYDGTSNRVQGRIEKAMLKKLKTELQAEEKKERVVKIIK